MCSALVRTLVFSKKILNGSQEEKAINQFSNCGRVHQLETLGFCFLVSSQCLTRRMTTCKGRMVKRHKLWQGASRRRTLQSLKSSSALFGWIEPGTHVSVDQQRRANVAHRRQSRPDHGLGLQLQVLSFPPFARKRTGGDWEISLSSMSEDWEVSLS